MAFVMTDERKNGEAPVKSEPTLNGLIAWLETQNPNTEYDYFNFWGECLICRYLAAVTNSCLGYSCFLDMGTRIAIAARGPHTFGAALERAKKIQATTSSHQ